MCQGIPVLCEIFKSENIKNTDGFAVMPRTRFWLEDSFVDFVHNPDEHSAIDAFHESITDIHGDVGIEHGHNAFPASEDCLLGQSIIQSIRRHLKETSHPLQTTLVHDLAGIDIFNSRS
jgi:hypothetical protein